jgi:hypothetical protein
VSGATRRRDGAAVSGATRRRDGAAVSGATRRSGFTLVELLLASALLIAMLATLTAMLAQGRSTQRIREAQNTILHDQEAIARLLQYELALAGYGGLGEESLLDPALPTLTIDLSAAAHAVGVRYVEDQFVAGGAQLRSVRLWVDPTESLLLRSVADGAPTALATGIDALTVRGYLRRDFGVVPAIDDVGCGGICPPPDFIAGLVLALSFTAGTEAELTVGFYNPQRVALLP